MRIYLGGEIRGAWDLRASMVKEARREQALTRGAAALVLTPAFAAPTVA